MIKGVNTYQLKKIHTPKGDIFHALKRTDTGYSGFGEAYFSFVKFNEIKGWKRHNDYVLNLIVPMGKIKFVIFDDRENSDTKGQFEEIIISPDENYIRLVIQPGLWMAFTGLDKNESMLLDIIPQPHDPREADTKDIIEIPYLF